LKGGPGIPFLRCNLGSAPEFNATKNNMDTISENRMKRHSDRGTSSMPLQNEQEIQKEDRRLSDIVALCSVGVEKS